MDLISECRYFLTLQNPSDTRILLLMFDKYFWILAEGLCVEGIPSVLLYHAKATGRMVKKQEASDGSNTSTSVQLSILEQDPLDPHEQLGISMQEQSLAGDVMVLALVPVQSSGSLRAWGIEVGCEAVFHVWHLDTLRLERPPMCFILIPSGWREP